MARLPTELPILSPELGSYLHNSVCVSVCPSNKTFSFRVQILFVSICLLLRRPNIILLS